MADGIMLQKNSQTPIQDNVFGIFSAYLAPRSTVSAAQTAASIARLAPATSSGVDEEFFQDLWRSFIGAAEQIPHDDAAQDKLARVVRELTLIPASVWADLPQLGLVFREHLNGPAQCASAEQQARVDAAWVRFHAFAARLMGAGAVRFVNQPVWMLRAALEEENQDPAALDRGLATAAVYIEYAGPVLLEALAADPAPQLTDELRRVLRGGPLYAGPPGLTPERWAFWAARFGEEAANARSEEAKEMALRAARLMRVWGDKRLKM
ncbi:hypothetical protein GGR52DRAFT_25391 [Hypoxylon sp. FL1284]|nr:hypothetical protein GGR52DRAFT_25391 [Hypoxylon sp. FL1284]